MCVKNKEVYKLEMRSIERTLFFFSADSLFFPWETLPFLNEMKRLMFSKIEVFYRIV